MEVLFFALKALIVVLSLGSLVILVAQLASRSSQQADLEVEALHKRWKSYRHALESFERSKKDLKALRKKHKQEEKDADAKESTGQIYVLDFDGSKDAAEVESLREEINALLQVATPKDEVVVRLESPGGTVHGYGFGAAQLMRLKQKQIPLTVSVDRIAASGGYMMACVADKIIASPFALVGSIGVVASLPNFNRLLEKNSIDFKEYTAGEFKRTVGLFAPITEKGESKFREQLEDMHRNFKGFVMRHRPQIDAEKTTTGEFWVALDGMKLGLVDHIATSDEYLLEKVSQGMSVLHVQHSVKLPFFEKIAETWTHALTKNIQKTVKGWMNQLEKGIFSA